MSKEWGNHYWYTMKHIAQTVELNDDTRPSVISFYESLKLLLPCEECRNHYTDYLDGHPIDTTSNAALLNWIDSLQSTIPTSKPKPRNKPRRAHQKQHTIKKELRRAKERMKAFERSKKLQNEMERELYPPSSCCHSIKI